MTKQEQFLSYAHAFLVAAAAHATAAKEKGLDGEVDGMMCIIALQNSVVGAIRTLGKGHHAVQKYKLVAGDLKDVRDMLTHFDEYSIGEGKLQEKIEVKVPPPPPPTLLQRLARLFRRSWNSPASPEVDPESEIFGWLPMWNSDETMMILNRRKGDDVPTTYEVPIHRALRNVAVLVSAAATSIGKKPSPLLIKLTGPEGHDDL